MQYIESNIPAYLIQKQINWSEILQNLAEPHLIV